MALKKLQRHVTRELWKGKLNLAILWYRQQTIKNAFSTKTFTQTGKMTLLKYQMSLALMLSQKLLSWLAHHLPREVESSSICKLNTCPSLKYREEIEQAVKEPNIPKVSEMVEIKQGWTSMIFSINLSIRMFEVHFIEKSVKRDAQNL